jgi:Big-like domain-containing protein
MCRPLPTAVHIIAFAFSTAVLACGGDLVLPTLGGPAADIQIVKGNEQKGAAGTMLPDSIVVVVKDSAGNPVVGQQVAFVPDAAGASVTPETAMTDSTGRAGARWVLDATPGPQAVVARVIGDGVPAALHVRFTASATGSVPGPSLVLRIQPSAAAGVSEVLSRQPEVQIQDPDGEDIKAPGVPVTVAVASGSGALGGVTTQLTDANGTARFTDLRVDGATGQHVLIFAAAGYTSVLSDPIEVGPVAAGNQPPVAMDDEYETLEGGERTLGIGAADGVLRNDHDPDGDPLTASDVGQPANGRTSLESDGAFRYTPDYSFYGDDDFTYRVSDPAGGSSTATVTIHVIPINDRPRFQVAVDPVIVPSGQTVRTIVDFVMAITPGAPNETDQVLTFEVVGNSNPGLFISGPKVTRDSPASETGTLTFTPAEGHVGSADVSLILRDNGGTDNGGKDTSHTETFRIVVRSE